MFDQTRNLVVGLDKTKVYQNEDAVVRKGAVGLLELKFAQGDLNIRTKGVDVELIRNKREWRRVIYTHWNSLKPAKGDFLLDNRSSFGDFIFVETSFTSCFSEGSDTGVDEDRT